MVETGNAERQVLVSFRELASIISGLDFIVDRRGTSRSAILRQIVRDYVKMELHALAMAEVVAT
jgi:metal-responsive CopG/Arc/MetJ family transcriptional regulator